MVANTVEQCAQATASQGEDKPADGQVSSAEQPQCRVVFMFQFSFNVDSEQ